MYINSVIYTHSSCVYKSYLSTVSICCISMVSIKSDLQGDGGIIHVCCILSYTTFTTRILSLWSSLVFTWHFGIQKKFYEERKVKQIRNDELSAQPESQFSHCVIIYILNVFSKETGSERLDNKAHTSILDTIRCLFFTWMKLSSLLSIHIFSVFCLFLILEEGHIDWTLFYCWDLKTPYSYLYSHLH